MSKDMDAVRDMDTVFYLDTVTEATLKPSKHFVVLTESDLHSKFLDEQGYWLCSAKLLSLPAFFSA